MKTVHGSRFCAPGTTLAKHCVRASVISVPTYLSTASKIWCFDETSQSFASPYQITLCVNAGSRLCFLPATCYHTTDFGVEVLSCLEPRRADRQSSVLHAIRPRREMRLNFDVTHTLSSCWWVVPSDDWLMREITKIGLARLSLC